ncbi:MAG: class I SAM-dependent methyltransferase [Luteibaculaceae bacterium]
MNWNESAAHWNKRYKEESYSYGTKPNEFFKSVLDTVKPGKLLLPAEGEGRNAVYAARKGWQVMAFDISPQGKEKAEQLAIKNNVKVDYLVGAIEELKLEPESFDAIALIYAHTPETYRPKFHTDLTRYLKPNGKLFLEGFSTKNLEYRALNPKIGGPPQSEMLFTTEIIRQDFKNLQIELLEEREVELAEGVYHNGLGAVIRLIANKT